MDDCLQTRGAMFLAQNMLFAKHIVKLVDIYGRSFFHSITIYEIKLYFKK